MLTLKQLRRFAKTRNKSGFDSNLQFQIDADACGFQVKDLGDPKKFTVSGFTGYEWLVPTDNGNVIVIEFGRRIYIADDDDADTDSMMGLMKKAVYEKVVA